MRSTGKIILSTATTLFAFSSLAAFCQTSETQKQSWVAASHQSEKTPLEDSAMKATDAAVHEVMNDHDFHVALCQKYFATFKDLNYKYRKAILDQYLLGASAFQVEHPEVTTDANHATSSVNLGGVQSVILTYQAILQQDHDAHNKILDDLVKRKDAGKLEDTVRKDCK